MTREHKLSLIIGFVLILIVGVLISDHMSDQRRVQLASVAVDDERTTLGLSDAINPVEKWMRENAAEMAAAAQTDEVPQPRMQQPLAMESSTAPVEPRIQEPAPINNAPFEYRNGSLASRDGVGNMEQALADAGARLQRGPDGTPTLLIPETVSPRETRPADTASRKPEARTQPEVDPKDVKVYRIQPKDSLYSIAKANYDDPSLWKALAEYNEGRVGKDGTVRVGATIKLPPKHVLTGGSPEPASRRDDRTASRPEPTQPTKKTEAAPPAKQITHTVVKGDTLSKIAERYLGSKSRASEIMALNNITDADQIRLGAVLKIPAK